MTTNLQILTEHIQTIVHSLYPIVAVLALVVMKIFFTRHILDNKKFNQLVTRIDTYLKSLESAALDLNLKHYQQKQLDLLNYQLATGIALKDYRMLKPALIPLKDAEDEDLRLKKRLFPLLSIKDKKLHLSYLHIVQIFISFFIGAILLVFTALMAKAYVYCLTQSAWQLVFATGLYAALLFVVACKLLGDGLDTIQAFKYFQILKTKLKDCCI